MGAGRRKGGKASADRDVSVATVSSALLSATCRAVVVADLYLAALCFQRWIAPLSSFSELTAVWSTAGLGTVVLFVLAMFRKPFQLVKTALNNAGINLDTLMARIVAVPRIPPVSLFGLVPLFVLLAFSYHALRPVIITVVGMPQ